MRNLPVEITLLNSLLSLKVANNKLIEVPPGLSSLQRLENLDFSNNRLTSLENLDLLSMYNLQSLNLQVCVTEIRVSFLTHCFQAFSLVSLPFLIDVYNIRGILHRIWKKKPEIYLSQLLSQVT